MLGSLKGLESVKLSWSIPEDDADLACWAAHTSLTRLEIESVEGTLRFLAGLTKLQSLTFHEGTFPGSELRLLHSFAVLQAGALLHLRKLQSHALAWSRKHLSYTLLASGQLSKIGTAGHCRS